MKLYGRYIGLAALMVLLGACAANTNPRLEEARSSYQATKNEPAAARAAPVALRQAKANIERAQAAFNAGETAATEHYAYLAERHIEVAQTQGEQSRLQDEVESASERRKELRLRAERKQAQAAKREALSAQQQAEAAQNRAQALQAQLQEMQAERTERGIVLTLGDVLFDTDKAQLKPGGLRTVNKLAAFLNEHGERRVRIEGHTDSRGTAAYNQDLSKRRALAVSSALISRNIDPSRITTVGLGESYPKTSNDTAAGRQQNRRVEIVISDDEGNIGRRGG